MKISSKNYVVILFLLFFNNITSQDFIIKGKIIDSIDSTSIGLASVLIRKYNSNKILSYTTTNQNGMFFISIKINPDIYTLEVNHLNYNQLVKEIVVSSDETRTIEVNESLIPKLNILDEVIIKKGAPIIVKKDTIIYDIGHWIKQNDQTLEEVLSKIEGFKIDMNGEIQVNGKIIRKILIDGKETSNLGAALLTKSIDPKDVKKIEVRFDEKNNKIKESLLESENYAVLDIKLNDDLNKSFFGKIRLTTGHRSKIAIGGYSNIFSLNEKSVFHFFGESDNFGNQTISLKNIKNIGKEAFQEIFELPADFQSLTEKEGYHAEIYGFNDFTLAKRNIIGFSSKFELSKKWSLFFGTFNIFNKTKQANETVQIFENYNNIFQDDKSFNEFNSKNKLEFKYDDNYRKARFDINFVYNNNNQDRYNHFIYNDLEYSFDRDDESLSYYNNLFFEEKFSTKLGMELKASYSHLNSDKISFLKHNDKTYDLFSDNELVYQMKQFEFSESSLFNTQAKIQYRSKLGSFEIGNLFENRMLYYKSLGVNPVTDNYIPYFSQEKTKYLTKRIKPFINHYITFNAFSFTNKLGYSIVKYPNENNKISNDQQINYYSRINYSLNNFDMNISYDNRYSSFPLVKKTIANTLIDFQTIEVRANKIVPVKETVVNFSLFKSFKSILLETDMALLSGNNFMQNRYLQSNSSIITIQRDQLKGSYQALSIILKKRFKKFPITFTLEPEALFNQNDNIIDDILYKTEIKRWLLGLKVEADIKPQNLHLYFYPKYTRIDFSNTLYDVNNNQEMLSLLFNCELGIFNNKYFINLSSKYVNFLNFLKSDYLNINAKFSGRVKKFNWFIDISNLTNDQSFIVESIYPTYFVSQRNQVFGRYIKLGLEYKFR